MSDYTTAYWLAGFPAPSTLTDERLRELSRSTLGYTGYCLRQGAALRHRDFTEVLGYGFELDAEVRRRSSERRGGNT